MRSDKDPMGRAIADYYKDGKAARLRVFSPMFDEDEIPVATLFRRLDEMPAIEREALNLATGHILDVGAGAGCHAMALQ
ncbi:MAG: SAM-dependent methyltransferase, partial [Muribaculaceae bacterium]|nr:SAM-dependent methyltransferase [Muribaculaceae bacterium]